MGPGGVPRTVVTVVLVASLVAAGGGASAQGGGALAPQTGAVDPDGVVLRVDVAADGSATWAVEYRIRLDDDDTTAAFESLQGDLRENRTAFRERFAGRMGRAVDAAENETGRSMGVRNVSVVAERRELPQSYGVVAYRFEWTGFARVDGDRIVAGDAVSGIFLDEETRLVVSWPAGYEASSVSPGGFEDRDGAVAWVGPVDFGQQEPRIVFQPAGGGGDGGFPVGLVAGALVLVGLAAAAGYGYRRRGGATGGSGAAGAVDDDGPEGGAAAADDPPEELLSPEERVLRFVRENGGRAKQQAVVAEFDWTAARTSQVVGSLRDDGEVETFRLGRENVITLPDVGVEGDADGDASEG